MSYKEVNINDWIKQKFGSKRGMMRFVYFQCLLKIGCFRRYQNIDFSKITRLVFICAGNICRSPLAEAVAKKQGFNACSFGLDTRGGDAADQRAILYGYERQFDLTLHKTKKINEYSYQKGDLLVVMEPWHLKIFPFEINDIPITLAGLWLVKPVAYLHDPYNTSGEYFERCEDIVVDSTNNLLKLSTFSAQKLIEV